MHVSQFFIQLSLRKNINVIIIRLPESVDVSFFFCFGSRMVRSISSSNVMRVRIVSFAIYFLISLIILGRSGDLPLPACVMSGGLGDLPLPACVISGRSGDL